MVSFLAIMAIKWIAVLLVLGVALAVTCSRVQEHGSFSGPNKNSIKVYKNSDLLTRTAVKTIHSEDGDVIECIDIFKQPAFDHPALRSHKIQMAPTHNPVIESLAKEEFHNRKTAQLWQKSGACPDRTIPIRKRQRNVGNIRKEPQYNHHHNQTEKIKHIQQLYTNRSLAILHADGQAYYGGKGDIKVWTPQVEQDDEYSTSQVALRSGPRDNYETMESGWAVNPAVYGDRQTRLFVYWTVDGSKNTGCFDHTCPGFMQISREVALGASIYSKISPTTDFPEELSIFIHKDVNTDNWWVTYRDTNLGYWPGELFSMLKFHAETVQWGGEVYSTRVGSVHPHTATQMGNGEFSSFRYGGSGSIRKIRVLVGSQVIKFPDYAYAYADEFNCYDTYLVTAFVDDPEFFYGGPGRSPRCP